MDKFLHERNLELYHLQLNRTTDANIRRQILRLIEEENKRYVPQAGRTAPNLSFSRSGGAGSFPGGSVSDKKE